MGVNTPKKLSESEQMELDYEWAHMSPNEIRGGESSLKKKKVSKK